AVAQLEGPAGVRGWREPPLDPQELVAAGYGEGPGLVIAGAVRLPTFADVDLGDAGDTLERHLLDGALEAAVEAHALRLQDPHGAVGQQLDRHVEALPVGAPGVLCRGRPGPGGQQGQAEQRRDRYQRARHGRIMAERRSGAG